VKKIRRKKKRNENVIKNKYDQEINKTENQEKMNREKEKRKQKMK